MATPELDPDAQVKALAFTKKNYRDVYPAVDPSGASISQAGKVIVITGGSRGLGRLVSTRITIVVLLYKIVNSTNG